MRTAAGLLLLTVPPEQKTEQPQNRPFKGPISVSQWPRLAGRLARDHGFDLWGLTSTALHSPARENYLAWSKADDPHDMHWLAEHLDCRLDAAALGLEDSTIQSLVVLGQLYDTGRQPAGLFKHVARYARGRDYHNVLRKKARRLLKALQAEVPGLHGRVLVDSAPAAEKSLAVQAGLGWQGKNTLIIHPKLGSYFFLCLLAVNVRLESTDGQATVSPAERTTVVQIGDHCGRCTACLEACPTDALDVSRPGQLKASECIAYWNIEQKKPLSTDQLHKSGHWAFGCDICQEVCPFNRKSNRPLSLLFDRKPDGLPDDMTTDELLEMTDENRLNGSPLKRAGLARLQSFFRHIKPVIDLPPDDPSLP